MIEFKQGDKSRYVFFDKNSLNGWAWIVETPNDFQFYAERYRTSLYRLIENGWA